MGQLKDQQTQSKTYTTNQQRQNDITKHKRSQKKHVCAGLKRSSVTNAKMTDGKTRTQC